MAVRREINLLPDASFAADGMQPLKMDSLIQLSAFVR
jgi:hypothetical protein